MKKDEFQSHVHRRKRKRWRIFLFTIGVGLGAAGSFSFFRLPSEFKEGKVLPASTVESVPLLSQGDLVVWISDRDGNPELYLGNSRGSFVQRMTTTAEEESEPTISPQQTSVVFLSEAKEFVRMWSLDLVTKERQLLTISRRKPRHLTFSPDGEYLAFLEQNQRSGKRGGDLFVLSLRDQRVFRVASDVEAMAWVGDHDGFLDVRWEEETVLVLEFRPIEEQKEQSLTIEMAREVTAPLFFPNNRRFFFLDLTKETLTIGSMTFRGERHEDFSLVGIPTEKGVFYSMKGGTSREEVAIQSIVDIDGFHETIFVSLQNRNIEHLRARNVRWSSNGDILIVAPDGYGKDQLWVKDSVGSPAILLTQEGNNWF